MAPSTFPDSSCHIACKHIVLAICPFAQEQASTALQGFTQFSHAIKELRQTHFQHDKTYHMQLCTCTNQSWDCLNSPDLTSRNRGTTTQQYCHVTHITKLGNLSRATGMNAERQLQQHVLYVPGIVLCLIKDALWASPCFVLVDRSALNHLSIATATPSCSCCFRGLHTSLFFSFPCSVLWLKLLYPR